jgi:hypothetical protein
MWHQNIGGNNGISVWQRIRKNSGGESGESAAAASKAGSGGVFMKIYY